MTKTMCGADCWTYNRLVVSKVNLRLQPARRPQDNKLDAHSQFREPRKMDSIPYIVHSSVATTLRHPSRRHQDWLDENDDNIQRLLEEKHRLHKAHQDDTSSVSKKADYSNL